MKKRQAIRLDVRILTWVALALVLGFVKCLPVVHAETAARTTSFPSRVQPDQVCLTWSNDPCTTQTVQWRTSPKVKKGLVEVREKGAEGKECVKVVAEVSELKDPAIANDPLNRRFTAELDGLKPATTYAYRVGGKKQSRRSDWSEFTTAPQTAQSFSFVYLGDAQTGLDTWGRLLQGAYERHPEAAFYVMAGDIVNRGNYREEWDSLFHNAVGVFDRQPLVPALGNHDCAKGPGVQIYLQLFDLPQNGPENIAPERAYSLRYGNALFLVLDSNSPHELQRSWLESQLKSTDATWKFAVYHHPAYSSAPNRDNPTIREQWCDLFDQYHVDMALQGHDHGYLRTKPMRGGQVAASPSEGTIYVVSVSGTKHYEVQPRNYAAVSMKDISTYQVIDIETVNGNKLTYRAYDGEGTLRDEFVIEK